MAVYDYVHNPLPPLWARGVTTRGVVVDDAMHELLFLVALGVRPREGAYKHSQTSNKRRKGRLFLSRKKSAPVVMNYLVVDDAYLHHRLLVDDANILQPLGGFSYLLHEPPPSL